MTFSTHSKIYIAGHSAATAATKRPEQYHSTTVVYAVEAGFSEEWYTGLVGSSSMRRLESGGFSNLVVRDLTELDLTDPTATADFFQGRAMQEDDLTGGLEEDALTAVEAVWLEVAVQGAG